MLFPGEVKKLREMCRSLQKLTAMSLPPPSLALWINILYALYTLKRFIDHVWISVIISLSCDKSPFRYYNHLFIHSFSYPVKGLRPNLGTQHTRHRTPNFILAHTPCHTI